MKLWFLFHNLIYKGWVLMISRFVVLGLQVKIDWFI
jgi:hypothetical protein